MNAADSPEGGSHITPTTNGPYEVTGATLLLNVRGEDVTEEQTAYLCRCGGSKNKPFCDGTHKKIGFDGTEVAGHDLMADRRDTYSAEGITIFDDRTRCSHAGRCTDGLPQVWKLNEEPWIEPGAASAERIISTVRNCPSGALTYALPGTEVTVEEEMEQMIIAEPNGPYRLRGGIQVISPDGEPYERRNRLTLCRCGQSKNKPFCDGTHWDAGFKDPV